MSDDTSDAPRAHHTPRLDQLRKQAKKLLQAAREGDPVAIGQIHQNVPRLQDFQLKEVAELAQLADAQHTVARRAGFESWARLKHTLERAEPALLASRQLSEALLGHNEATVRRIVAEYEEGARFFPKVRELRAAFFRGDDTGANLLAGHEYPEIGSGLALTIALCAGNHEVALDLLAIAAAFGTQEVQEPDHDALAARERTPSGFSGQHSSALIRCCASPLFADSPERARSIFNCVKLLLDNGANPNAYNLHPPNAADGETQSRITALYHACTLGNEKVVRLLLERGADPWDGESVPHAAESNQRGSLELLLEFGADISAPVPVFDNTSLHFLATQLWDAKRYDNIMGGITWLLEHGADPNIVSLEARETPLHAAATTRRGLDAIRLFLYHGADVNARRADGRTAYTIAIRFGYTEIAELLLSHGANTGGTSPIDQLLGAAMRGAEDEALAILRANPGILEQFVPEDKAMLPDAIFSGTVESLRTMARVGFDLRWENSWGGTALHLAAWFGKIEMVRELLSHDAPVNVRDSRHGSSPIAWAAHGSTHCRNADDDYIAVIRLLLDAGSLPEFATNTWKELSSGMATPAVRRLLREHGF